MLRFMGSWSRTQLSDFHFLLGFSDGPDGKAFAYNVGNLGSIIWVRKISWRRKWQPTPVFLPGKSHGRRSLVSYSTWDLEESDMTKQLHFHFQYSIGNKSYLEGNCFIDSLLTCWVLKINAQIISTADQHAYLEEK